LPSYVDDVLEFDGLTAFPVTGEQGKIYVALDTDRIYRWSGAVYVELSAYPSDTDAVPEGTSNLYFTQPRVITALTENAEAARSALGVYSEGQTIPIFTAANIPLSQVGPIYVQGVGNMEWSSITGRYEIVVRGDHGQCRFQYVSSTECRLYPNDGDGLIIRGRQYRIPRTGVALAVTGLTPSATYNVYAYDNGSGGLALEASPIGHTLSAVGGIECKVGDESRTLVGKVILIAGPAFAEDTTQRYVASWFNRRQKTMIMNLTSNTFANTAPVQISNSVAFLAWADSGVAVSVGGNCSNVSPGTSVQMAASLNAGGFNLGYPSTNYMATANAQYNVSWASGVATVSEGFHSVSMWGNVSAGVGTVTATLGTMIYN
jgi:hypothetical protein